MKIAISPLALAPLILLAWPLTVSAQVDVEPLLEPLRAVDAKGKGHRAAIGAWQRLAKADAAQVPHILAGMDGAGILACNWIRAAVETIVARHLEQGGELPVRDLEQFLANTKHAPRARRLAYELVAQVDDDAESRLIPSLLDDPSPELRYDAVAWTAAAAERLVAGGDREAGLKKYQQAFSAARDPDQVQRLANTLEELGEPPNLADHFGFLLRWQLVGPFDHTGGEGYDIAYPPEAEVSLNAVYPGKMDDVRWIEVETGDNKTGIVDVNDAFERPKSWNGSSEESNPELWRRFKGVVTYAFTEFLADEAQDVELRLGTRNGHKVWLNGELIVANNVYHAGMFIDQYVGRGRLKPGRNEILVKIAQNEQTQSWAQSYSFQLRVCDQYGTAILSTDR
jgi:hypothetical protein